VAAPHQSRPDHVAPTGESFQAKERPRGYRNRFARRETLGVEETEVNSGVPGLEGWGEDGGENGPTWSIHGCERPRSGGFDGETCSTGVGGFTLRREGLEDVIQGGLLERSYDAGGSFAKAPGYGPLRNEEATRR
jgi:hypothetical protein